MHRVSPFRKDIVRFTTAPVVSPQPKPPMRGTNLPCPVAPGSGLLLAPRHGWNLRCGRAVLQAPLGCASHTWCGVVWGCFWAASRRPWGRSAGRPCPAAVSVVLSVRPCCRRIGSDGWHLRVGGGGSQARGGSRSMHNASIDALSSSRAVLRVPYVRSTAGPRGSGSVVVLCMPGAPRPVPWSTAPPSAARRFHPLALSHSRVRARRAWTPCGTGIAATARSASLPRLAGLPQFHPEDVERSETPN